MTEDERLDAAVRRTLFGNANTKTPTDPERFRNRLALFLLLAFIGSLPLLVWKTIPDGNKDTITYILGQISGMATTVVGFYFVSKAGEAKLDKQRTDNTTKALDAITSAIQATPSASADVATGRPDDPVHTVEEVKP